MRRLTLLACLCLLPLMGQAQEKTVIMPSKGEFMQWCIPDLAKELNVSEEVQTDTETFGRVMLICQCELEKMPSEGAQVSQGQLNSATNQCGVELDDIGWDGLEARYIEGAKRTFDTIK